MPKPILTLLQIGRALAGVRLGAVGEGFRRRQELRRLEPVLEPRLERLAPRVGRRAAEGRHWSISGLPAT